MRNTTTWLKVALGGSCLVLLVLGGGVLVVRGAGGGPAAGSPAVQANDPAVEACVERREINCNPNPAVYPTFIANNPVAQPPNTSAAVISEARALEIARGPSLSAPAHAAFVTHSQLVAMDQSLADNGVVNPDRKLWVVTVQADTWSRGSPSRKPWEVHSYTVVIDAQTGIVTDACYGCTTVK